ncbi:MAG: hypothetical protein M1817_002308 [Caeruleum heppii]|nr:MAG: hypothetical protein M1817_003507 [Caeruleum heppii]KAI9673670.1 MAG: hypothetical protein M1817_002308 [Caeruleum heppii]
MRLNSIRSSSSLTLTFLLALLPLTAAVRLIESKSLNPCMPNNKFSASLFDVIFTPDNGTLHFEIIGVSSIAGNITAELEVVAYGYTALKQKIDPCMDKKALGGFCPMTSGQINIPGNAEVGPDVVKQVPSIAYNVPDLDGLVRIRVNDSDTNTAVACLEAPLSNGKTVDQKGVGWSTAIIAGIGLLASAVTSGLGHSNTAAHIAANALSLFGYFQAQAMIGMTAVTVPPIVQSWTQNFDWSMGIINVEFMQNIFTWYQRATGGKPANLLSELTTTSVEVQKRSEKIMHGLFKRAYNELMARSNSDNTINEVQKTVIVKGIDRVSFRANIESTNLFMTGLTFFIIFVTVVALGVAAFKGLCEVCVKAGWFKSDKFQDFRNGWLIVLKGILFRLTLIGFPQICVLCLWELTQNDSPAEIVLALFFLISMSGTLVWAALKVIRIAKRSVDMHKNPAYILYSDPAALNKWGFLYVQFRASAYYFILPVLAYTFVKAAFIGLGQGNGLVQAIALVLIEAGVLIAVSILRPWMDKKTNTFNIAIAAINFINVIFLLVFTEIFNQPGIVTGVMGVVFFVLNAIFALVLLILVLVSSMYAIFSKNPDTRYQPMRDDRGSFIKSQTQLNTELDALGATARGDVKAPYRRDLDDDDDSFSSASLGKHHDASGVALPPSTSNSNMAPSYRDQPRSPVSPSMPMFPSDGSNRHAPPDNYSDHPRPMYGGYGNGSRPGSDLPLLDSRSNTASPRPRDHNQGYGRTGSSNSNLAGYRSQNNGSPWQRGAGYDR